MSLKTYENILSLNQKIKSTITANLELSRSFYIKGELSNVSYSGTHMYFTLKDNTGEIPCAFWRYASAGIVKDSYKNGQAVLIRASVDVYVQKGKCQLIVTAISLEGEGKRAEEFGRLKAKLEAEGLFDDAHKKPMPTYPRVVGLVTSVGGEGFYDITNTTYSIYPHIKFVVYPSKAQGVGAAETIVNGIKHLDKMGLDLIVIGRGGGPEEDRWAFNEEIVARAVYEANTPIMSAVGHERNIHLSDLVADISARSPIDAGKLLTENFVEAMKLLEDYRQKYNYHINVRCENVRLQMDSISARLEGLSPQRRLENQHKQLELYSSRLKNTIDTKYNKYANYLDNSKTRLMASGPEKLYEKRLQEFRMLNDNLIREMSDKYNKSFQEYRLLLSKLHALSPTAKLTNGYGFISYKDNALSSVHEVSKGDMLTLRISDGLIDTVVDKVTEDKIV